MKLQHIGMLIKIETINNRNGGGIYKIEGHIYKLP